MQNYKGLNFTIVIMEDWADQLFNSKDPEKVKELESIKLSIGESILSYLTAFGQIPQPNTEFDLSNPKDEHKFNFCSFCDYDGEHYQIQCIAINKHELVFYMTENG